MASTGIRGVLLVGLLTLAPAAEAQPAWRVRAGIAAPVNADGPWAAGLSQTAIVQADRPFRIRFEWERSKAYVPGMPGVILQYRRNGEDDWTEVGAYDFPYPKGEEARSPRVSVVRSPGYMHGEPTEDLLRGSTLAFAGGSAVSLAAAAPSWSTRDGHMELEWPLVIRRWVDGAESNEAGDRFELRLAEATGEPLAGAGVAAVELAITPRHIGGTFVETPGRIGPWQAGNGDLYFIMEPAESSNLFMMIKSSDGGLSWREVDGAHRPEADDLESVDGRQRGDTIEIVHQVTSTVYRHAFRTSDHPTAPDTWAITDEVVAKQRSMAQAASLVARSDGSFVAFYVGETLRFSIRSPDGAWGSSQLLDAGEAPFLAGPQATLGKDDVTHLAYYGRDGTIWYRKLDARGAPGPAMRLADGVGTGRDAYGAILPLVYLPEGDTVVVVYQLADLRLRERRIAADGSLSPEILVTHRAVVRQAADSQQPGADLIAAGDSLHVLFIDNETRQIYSASDAQDWRTATLREPDVQADWVRAMAHETADGNHVVRYVFDAGSGGGSGMNRYGEYAIESD